MSDKITKDFIVYLEDDDSKKEIYVDIIEVNTAFISFKTSKKKCQYFCAEEIQALSSGECAPLIVGPKETISISG